MTAAAGTGPGVAGSQHRWRVTRQYLDTRRWELARAAAELYPRALRTAGTPLLAGPGWLPAAPVELGSVALQWRATAAGPVISGTESQTAGVRPLRVAGARFDRYADAVGALRRPGLFEDRTTYRLLSLDWRPPGQGTLGLTGGRYFDVLNISEAVGHEFAAAHRAGEPTGALPFRSLIGDPFDLARRPILPAISTLTLRRDPGSGDVRMFLHWRDPAQVASGGGLYQVMPVGMFQPSVEPPPGEPADLDLWHAIAREFSEEFLGEAEHLGRDGEPFDYGGWSFLRPLDRARRQGRLRLYCLGAGVDPLTLVTDLLTVAVIDAEVFDAAFAGRTGANAEGQVISGVAGLPFTAGNVDRFARTEPMQAAGAALLALAWRHRAHLW